jgi:CRISPR-associated protein Csb1
MEPIFKRDPYHSLVPRVIIKAGDREISLLDASHRAADAIVRFTFGPSNAEARATGADDRPLGQQLWDAFEAWQEGGNAEPLARIAPTSIIFGCWDSRGTQAKLPRIVRSVIRAYDVKELHRSAQYSTIAGEILEGGDAEVTTKGPKAELGLAHVPAVMKHGGVEVHGDIRRDAVLNLVALRSLGVSSAKEEEILKLRRYLLGLALVALTADLAGFLREGCHLVPDTGKETKWCLVKHDGSRANVPELDSKVTRTFAEAVAKDFGVAKEPINATFDPQLASAVLNLSKEERKKLLRQGPVSKEALGQLKSGSKGKADRKP